jgi:hypothetical protein
MTANGPDNSADAVSEYIYLRASGWTWAVKRDPFELG